MSSHSRILVLLALAAIVLALSAQRGAAGEGTSVRVVVHDENGSAEAPVDSDVFDPHGGVVRLGAASGEDFEDDSVGLASLADSSPFQEEPLPIPPGEGDDMAPLGPTPATPQDGGPPGELPGVGGDLPYVDRPLTEPMAEDRPEGLPLDEEPWAEPAWDGQGDVCTECGTYGDECGSPRRRFWGLRLDAWISQGLTINTDSPTNRSNYPVVFNDRSNDYQMNQLYVSLARPAREGGWRWDVGGQVDLLYGTDQIYATARGLETRGDGSDKWNSGRYGLAMPQAYMEVYAPWGNGLTMKLGHFYTLIGYETIPAVENFFYSKSLVLEYGQPDTHTGLLGSTRLGILNVHAGMTRGWDNWEDNNNDLAFLGGVDWASPSEQTSIAFAIHVGREQDEPPASTNVRTVYSLVARHWLTQRLLYAIEYDHGFEDAAAAYGADADWFGINQYLYYTISPCWRTGVRFEWFRDEDATRIDSHVGADYFALSLGVNWMPTERVTVRPEVRWDWADALGGGSLPPEQRDDQILVAFDVILRR